MAKISSGDLFQKSKLRNIHFFAVLIRLNKRLKALQLLV